MTDDTTPPSTGESAEKGAFGILLGAAAWSALTWLEKREKRRLAAEETPSAPSPGADAATATVVRAPGAEPARPAMTPPASRSRPGTERQVATVLRDEQTVPYRVPINQGGITVYYNAGTLSSTVNYTAVVAGRDSSTSRIVAGPATDVEDLRAKLRADGWQRVPSSTPEQWENIF